MKNIKEFKSRDELINYFKKNAIKFIHEGAEGKIYLTKDGEVIKYMPGVFEPKPIDQYPDIIMHGDIELESFIFPKELFVLNGIIVGYREDYFKGNVMDNLDKVDIDSLVKARKRFIEDAKVMADNKYYLFELLNNLVFDNKRLVAIDTLDYKKDNNVTLKDNISSLDYALLNKLGFKYPDIDVKKPFEEEIEKVYKLRR